MATREILSAWRDRDYWLSLSEGERAQIPENPAGVIELMDAEMEFVAGGTTTTPDDTCHESCISTYTGDPICCF